VAGFQLAIMLAAGIGGLVVDASGVDVVYVVGTAAVMVGAVLFFAAGRTRTRR
jgi:predicted MFS family arabinose efflux permease